MYLDVLLLTNFLMAYFLLLAAGALSGQRAGFVRMLAGSGLAAMSSLILFAPPQPYLVQVVYKITTALAITAAAFGWRSKRRLVTVACWYAALNIALAGAVLLAVLRTGTRAADTANLTVYLRVSPLLLLALSGVCCGAVELGLRLLMRRDAPIKTVGLEFELCSQPIRLRAAPDTGCHLRDPITCLPVLVVSYPDAKARLPGPRPARQQESPESRGPHMCGPYRTMPSTPQPPPAYSSQTPRPARRPCSFRAALNTADTRTHPAPS